MVAVCDPDDEVDEEDPGVQQFCLRIRDAVLADRALHDKVRETSLALDGVTETD